MLAKTMQRTSFRILFSAALAAGLTLSPCKAADGDSASETAPRPEEKGPAASAEAALTSLEINCDTWEEGVPPEDLFVLDGTVKIVTKDGSKAVMIDPVPIVDAGFQIGQSAAGTAIVEARFLASKRGRSYPRFGVSVHGLTGYRLYVNCSRKTLELIHQDTVVKSCPFTWTSETWTSIKLEAILGKDNQWHLGGKAWPSSSPEPADPMLIHQEPREKLKGNGKVTLWGTPFSETPIYLDNIKTQVATAKPARS
jgi:hypothetical protein